MDPLINIEKTREKFDETVFAFGTETNSNINNSELGSFINQGLTADNSFILEENNSRETVILNVSTFADQNDGSSANGLSLRDAILRAKADPAKDYVIILQAGTYELFIQGNEDSLFPEDDQNLPGDVDDIVARTGDLDINTRVRIVGISPEATIINASNLGDRIFDVREGGYLSLENVSVEGGFANSSEEEGSSGGGIRIDTNGSALIYNSIIRDNETSIEGTDNNNGGGIANFGYTELISSIVSGNLSGDDAGGIYNTGVIEIQYSTIAGNFANAAAVEVIEAGGGGIYNTLGGTLNISNSTISGNITGDAGGGILNENATAIVRNVTIANNTAQIGSGITSLGADNPLDLQNSIVADNNDSADIEGYFTQNSSFNLIGNGNGIILNDFNNNIVGDITNPLAPQLEPLADNGGLTPTHALRENSPAINAGSNEIASQVGASDQRGVRRILDGTVDIGSYEYSENQLLDTPLYRLQNTEQAGTYLFVGYEERQQILLNYTNFTDEGFAFTVAVEPHDDLMAIYRFQNQDLPGTYLYVAEQERQSILANYNNFIEEGLAFYVYGADSNQGQDIYRFQNSNVPGTYLFVNQAERDLIRENYPNFIEEGIAWEAGF